MFSDPLLNISPFRNFEEILYIRDLICSDSLSDKKAVCTKLEALEQKYKLPHFFRFTYCVVYSIASNNREYGIEALKQSFSFFKKKQMDEIGINLETLGTETNESVSNKVHQIFELLKTNFWEKIEDFDKMKRENKKEQFIAFINDLNTKLFCDTSYTMQYFLVPEVVHSIANDEKPFGIEVNESNEKNFTHFFNDLKNKYDAETALSFMYSSEKAENAPFIERLHKFIGDVQEVPYYELDSPDKWPPTPVGQLYGKKVVSNTLPMDMVCEVELLDGKKPKLIFPGYPPIKIEPPKKKEVLIEKKN